MFLTMGLQLESIVSDVEQNHAGAGTAGLIAAGALVLTVLVRAAYVAPLLAARGRHSGRMRARVHDVRERMNFPEHQHAGVHRGRRPAC